MRTAECYLIEEFEPGNKDCQTVRDDLRLAIILNPSLEKFEKAINEARKETIEECAALVIPDGNPEIAINKIYSLINELK